MKVRLESKDPEGRKSIEVDGVRLKGVRATDIRVEATKVDRVVVEFVFSNEGVWYESDDAKVIVKPEQAASLIALGWKPPVESD